MILPFDELNNFRSQLEIWIASRELWTEEDRKQFRKWCEDEILELLLISYTFGCEEANGMLNSEIAPTYEEMRDSVYKKIAGKDFAQRIAEYADTGTVEDIMRVAETDSHRVFNDAAFTTAKQAGATQKIWNCMFRNSRDTHMYLDGTAVPIDAEFYTFMGNHAMYPGEFGVAEEDCNCQCWVTYTK